MERIELNCRFDGYDDESTSLVLFYFAGTRELEEAIDGRLQEASSVTTEDSIGVSVPEIRPVIVDGWYNDREELEFICLQNAFEDDESVLPDRWEFVQEERRFVKTGRKETELPKDVFASAA